MEPTTNETEPRVEVPVWDWPVRVVHWTIALLVAAQIATGLIGNEALVWHMRCGEALLALVLFRVIWGFAGSGNARFSSFVRGPGAVLSYVRSLFRPPHEVHATHNPIGGWMVIALLLAMLVQAGTGLCTQDDIGNEGPLVKLVSGDLSESLGYLHRRVWWVVAGLASLHILAVIGYFAVLGDDLISPMVTGTKRLPARVANAANAASSSTRALVLLAALAALMWWVVNRL
jgi:cytochrome b